MDPALHIDHLRTDSAALLVAHAADPTAPVPSCPGWDRTVLLGHVAGAQSWIRAQVEAGPAERIRMSTTPRPPEGPELPGWFEANAAATALALSTMDTSIEWPTWAGPQPGTFYPRRASQETLMHRWDAADGPIDAALAVDGVDELLEVFAWLVPAERLASGGGTIHLHATDVEGEWLVRLGPEGITFERGHAKGDVALRGTAQDLLLWAWNRLPVGHPLEVFGDAALLELWRTAVVF
jgi:uncharacterized protein (TIGR03083 family)